MTYKVVTWRDVYPFYIPLSLVDLREVPFIDENWDQVFNDLSFKYHIDWDNQKLRFKTEGDKIEFILRWL